MRKTEAESSEDLTPKFRPVYSIVYLTSPLACLPGRQAPLLIRVGWGEVIGSRAGWGDGPWEVEGGATEVGAVGCHSAHHGDQVVPVLPVVPEFRLLGFYIYTW